MDNFLVRYCQVSINMFTSRRSKMDDFPNSNIIWKFIYKYVVLHPCFLPKVLITAWNLLLDPNRFEK